MCIGNRAEVSSHYINGQLRALYENALHCAGKHLHGLKPTMSTIEYATCLAEFYGPVRQAYKLARADLAFFAAFDYPRVEFVCNHEVVLLLNINEGHYNLDISKAWSKLDLNDSIEGWTLAFRIPFSSHAIENFHCKAIGNQEQYTTIFHVLELESAKFILEHSNLPGLSESTIEGHFFSKEQKLAALTHYLIKFYLPLVKRAGHHVLYSLPDFDNLKSTIADIDYSVINTHALATDSLYGVRVEDINVFLRGLWLQAAAFIDEHGHSVDTLSKSFHAELRIPPAEELDDMYLDVFFNPLQIQPLCEREVIVKLDIQDIHVYLGGFNTEAIEIMKDWKMAFIFDVVCERLERGSGKRISLDVSSARYCEHLSLFGEQHSEIAARIKATLIRQITTTYISILETSNVIFHHDTTVHGVGSEDGSGTEEVDGEAVGFNVDGCSCADEGSCGHTDGIRWGVLQRHILTQTYMSDYDLITSLTQASVERHFKALWEAARRRLSYMAGKKMTEELQSETCISQFSFVHNDYGEEVFFFASFDAPVVQLVCREGSQSVILYLHLKEGHLKTLGAGMSLQPGSESYSFSHWRLAFEVDLKIVDSSERSTTSTILKRLGLTKPAGFQQLVLSLSSAKFNLSLSTVPGLLDGSDYRAIRQRREALAYYIQTHYFPTLTSGHYDVLCTIAHGVPGTANMRHVLTSLRFAIVPFTYASRMGHLEGIFGRYRAVFERNSIVIFGVTRGQKLPQGPLPRGINWVCGIGKDVPNGAVYLSRKSFLEGVLLKKLEWINRETTIVPEFSGIHSDKWVLEFETWDEHRMTKALKCNWQEVTKADNLDSLEFDWRHEENWRYEATERITLGRYSVKCSTHNTLSIPTTQSGKPVIQIKGMFKLSLNYEGSGNDWSSETSINWSTNLVFNSTSSGLQVNLHPPRVVPEVRSKQVTHDDLGRETQAQALEQLKQKFPELIDFSALLEELKTELEGTWMALQVQAHELCVARPVFNRHGDLLLELIVRGTQVVDSFPYGSAGAGSLAGVNGNANWSSVKGSTVPVDMNGNGKETKGWIRRSMYKAGDKISSMVHSPSRSSSTSSKSSKSLSSAVAPVTASSTTVSEETEVVTSTAQEKAVSFVGENGHEKFDTYTEDDAADGDGE